MERARVLNIPNAITLMRIALAGMFLVTHFALPEKRGLSAVCFAAAGCTDFADGMLARRLGQVTWAGKLLDPLADKLLCLSALICLTSCGSIPVWIAAFVVLKELSMLAGASALLGRQIVIPADAAGKLATILFVPSVILLYPWHGNKAFYLAGRILMHGFLAASAWAAAHYALVAVKKSNAFKTD